MSVENEVVANDTIVLGDKAYDKDSISPSEYFEYVKSLKQTVDDEYLQLVIDNGLKMINRTKITHQTAMASQITHEVELALRELKAARAGFDIFVARKDIERYINNTKGKGVKIIELSRYTREIPDEVIDKISLVNDLFDEFYIIFTDYSLKDTKKIAKERREKDPILFGAFMDKSDPKDSNIYIEDRLFFIADWIEDKCDLTLKEIVQSVKKEDNRDIVYKVNCPEDENEIKKILNSFSEPAGEDNKNLKPEKNFLDKIKNKVKKAFNKEKSDDKE